MTGALQQACALAPALSCADGGNGRVRRAAAGLPGFVDADFSLPSEDGREVHLFTAEGRHIRTVDAVTGFTPTEAVEQTMERGVEHSRRSRDNEGLINPATQRILREIGML